MTDSDLAKIQRWEATDKQGTLEALGGGTGALSDNIAYGRGVFLRMRYQGRAALIMLLFIYLATLCVGLSMTYRQAENRSPVVLYADPRTHSALVAEDGSLESFAEAFCQAPKNVQLQVTGFVPMPDNPAAEYHPGLVPWNGHQYHVAFTFALDLSPWVTTVRSQGIGTGASNITAEASAGTEGVLDAQVVDGMQAEDRGRLSDWLARDTNDLATVEIQKEVEWPGWEELATNIKHRIRQQGFNGIIGIHQSESDCVQVYKNKPWANFLHSTSTKALCALSVVGWVVYLPYMHFRTTKLVVKCRYQVEMEIRQYWELIVDQLSAEGFSGAEARQTEPAGNAQDPVAVGRVLDMQ